MSGIEMAIYVGKGTVNNDERWCSERAFWYGGYRIMRVVKLI
jgi:hypothetical protein